MDIFWAHISEDGRRVQTVSEHLRGTAQLAAEFGRKINAEEQAVYAAYFHDIGKYSKEFQNRIRCGTNNVDHSTAGALELFKRGQLEAAFAVAGHHGGLPDAGNNQNTSDDPTLKGRLQRDLKDYSAWRDALGQLPIQPSSRSWQDNFTQAFYIRMLFSCLVDADFQDTENFMRGPQPRGGYASLPELLEKVHKQADLWQTVYPEKEIDRIRNMVLRLCMDAGKDSVPGLFTLSVPTGGGKTFSSLAFAMEHTVKNDMERVIYIVPYTSIIDQTVDVFRAVLGEENVLAHHAGADYLLEDPEDLTPEQYRHLLASENWDAPVIVTTAVQFFESLYANRPGKCRKLHNIANSVLIFDEAQSLPLPYLRPCVAAMAQLALSYHSSVVLCTATQPALDELFRSFAPQLQIREICSTDVDLYTVLRRTCIKSLGQIEPGILCRRLAEQNQVLCVVNRRKTAQTLYDGLPKEGRYCLTTLLTPHSRRERLAEIRDRLEHGLPCRVVSTSLIEAGVDVDFPRALREEAGLDSILQTAGRCNREGKLPAEESVVYIFALEGVEPSSSVTFKRDATNQIRLQYPETLDSPETINSYFKQLLYDRGEVALDIHGIVDGLTGQMNGSVFPFRQVADRFHMIDDPTNTVYIPIDKGTALCERMKTGDVSRTLYRQLGDYAVSVYEDHFQRLYNAGALELLKNGSAILIDPTRYSIETGLQLDMDSGQNFAI